MEITGLEFGDGDRLPEKHGYMGENVNPGLEIEDVPEEASSLALVFCDPDAEKMAGKTWIHWTVWGIDTGVQVVEEDSVPGFEGVTDFREKGYNGPNPPDGEHDVEFRVYALKQETGLEEEASYDELERELNEKKLDEAVVKARIG